MTIEKFLKKGILVNEPTSPEEIKDLFLIVERDFTDSASSDISYDWQFGIAYNAALKLATILVRASDLRVKGQGHHMNVIAAIPYILGEEKKVDSEYLDSCRKKRNIVEYDCVDGATESDVIELREFISEFRDNVSRWIKKNRPELLGAKK